MADHPFHSCDICGKLTAIDGHRMEHVNGVVATLGYSIGGWGNRNNFIDISMDEVCDECFEEYKTFSIVFGKWLERRKGTGAPDIDIRNREGRKGDQVPPVRPDKSPSKGCIRTLLRKLPFVSQSKG